jgi:hypothetical protein
MSSASVPFVVVRTTLFTSSAPEDGGSIPIGIRSVRPLFEKHYPNISNGVKRILARKFLESQMNSGGCKSENVLSTKVTKGHDNEGKETELNYYSGILLIRVLRGQSIPLSFIPFICGFIKNTEGVSR